MPPLNIAVASVNVRKARALAKRPALTVENAPAYLDWLTGNLDDIEPSHLAHHMAAAELVVRMHMGNAQAKTTHADLLRDGVIEQQ